MTQFRRFTIAASQASSYDQRLRIELSGIVMLRIFFLALALFVGQTSAMAASIFNAEVVLDDSDAATEQLAKEQAFVDVLIRASGQSNVGENPVVKKALPTVNQYITQLGYGDVDAQRSLILGFDDAKIRTLLTQAQAKYWGVPRPEVLFWVVQDQASSRNVVWEQSGSSLINELKAQGERRGLPVLMPVGDFDDVVAISIPDLWGGFAQPIAEASARYNPAGVAVVKMRGNQLSWQLFPNAATMGKDAPIEGRASGATADEFATMVDDISDFYAERFGVTLGVADSGAKKLNVSGMASAEDFFVLERTLKGLNSVAALRLESLINDTATFRVSLLASEDVFHNEMQSDRRLRRVETLLSPVELVNIVTPTPLAADGSVVDAAVVDTTVADDAVVIDGQAVQSIAPAVIAPIDPVEASLDYQWNG
ncbi:hypothetical protein A1OW_18810 [Enterovibrio norvegicus]|uniref:DUF2066 domain-containing protein n=1 Tax=Enterovibrio norvegicus TaxID=188144 RepID=A0ABV4LAQ5_9GAMM|nr:DUF2066 domain-containing protein [Enterovibrio norvegicus]OEF58967.1 hypothetical protein A1OU_12505 [Enterovibrio norvegicus]OEF62264.1 hypothetical protein A1OW_18810 [Enterovibrio norvegicus]PMH59683.1 hypothetical protein BCU62_22130 [Enterovibrio norvegicus]TKF34254.1 DUF2066 domain-containing protein [Enterovibrio norvegicus]